MKLGLRVGRWIHRHNKYSKVKEEIVNGLIDYGRFFELLTELYYYDLAEQDNQMEVLEEFVNTFSGAVNDIGTLMAACIDYRNLLIRASVPDSVSGTVDGVEAIMEKYGVVVEKRKSATLGLVTAYIRS